MNTKQNTANITSYYFPQYAIDAVNMFMKQGCKTNIHFVLSSESFPLAIDLLDGKDLWNNQIDLNRLNAVIFLLFKPIGNALGKDNLNVSSDNLKLFVEKCRKAKTKFKIGIDACLGNFMYKYCSLDEREKELVCSCESGRSSVYIGPDMKMSPCSFCKNENLKVDLNENPSIADVWLNSKQFVTNREILKKTPLICPVGAF